MTTPQPSRLVLDAEGRIVRAAGVIDSHTADDLLATLRKLGTDADATLDLAGVQFIDSSGLRAIITSHQEFDGASSRLVLTSPSESVQRLIEITGLNEHVHLA